MSCTQTNQGNRSACCGGWHCWLVQQCGEPLEDELRFTLFDAAQPNGRFLQGTKEKIGQLAAAGGTAGSSSRGPEDATARAIAVVRILSARSPLRRRRPVQRVPLAACRRVLGWRPCQQRAWPRVWIRGVTLLASNADYVRSDNIRNIDLPTGYAPSAVVRSRDNSPQVAPVFCCAYAS